MSDRLQVKIQVHEREAVEVLHLPYVFECPICRREQQHVLMCLLCGAIVPAECEDSSHEDAPQEFFTNGINLADLVKTRWTGRPEGERWELDDLVADPSSPVTKTSLGFLDEHSRPKWRPKGHQNTAAVEISYGEN